MSTGQADLIGPGRLVLVVGPSGELGNVIGRSIGFETADFAEVVYGVRSIGRAATDAQNEESSAARAQSDELFHALLAVVRVELCHDLSGFFQVLDRIGHGVKRIKDEIG